MNTCECGHLMLTLRMSNDDQEAVCSDCGTNYLDGEMMHPVRQQGRWYGQDSLSDALQEAGYFDYE